jgi:hypothetical protein
VKQPPSVQDTRLKQSIHIFSQEILKNSNADRFEQLGRCLMYLNCPDEACAAFEQRITSKPDKGAIMHMAYCSLCLSFERISSRRFVCKTCPDVDLCSTCMNKYEEGALVQGCQAHEFLEFPGQHWSSLRSPKVNLLGESLKDWLARMINQYSRT